MSWRKWGEVWTELSAWDRFRLILVSSCLVFGLIMYVAVGDSGSSDTDTPRQNPHINCVNVPNVCAERSGDLQDDYTDLNQYPR